MVLQNVVMVIVMVMKLMKHAQKIVMLRVSVQPVKLLTVMSLVSVGLKHGLEMDTVMVLRNSMALTFAAMIMMVETVQMLNVLHMCVR